MVTIRKTVFSSVAAITLAGATQVLSNFATPAYSQVAPVDLGAAASFGSFGGGAGITNQGIYTLVITTLNGRALGLNASVTMVNANINVPAP